MPGRAWTRLGDRVAAARVAAGFRTREAFAAHAGISSRTLGDVERGRRESYDPATLAAIEHALGWPSGSVDAMLAEDRESLPAEPPDALTANPTLAAFAADPLLDDETRAHLLTSYRSLTALVAARRALRPGTMLPPVPGTLSAGARKAYQAYDERARPAGKSLRATGRRSTGHECGGSVP